MQRDDLRKAIADIEEKIKALFDERKKLYHDDMLLCDERQWFEEKEEEVVISKRPKVKEMAQR